jgi:hypothetical protein
VGAGPLFDPEREGVTMTPAEIDRAKDELTAALDGLSRPEEIARRAVDRAYQQDVYLRIRNLARMLQDAMVIPALDSGTPCGPCAACHVRDEEPCPWGCECHSPVPAHEQIGRPFADQRFYRPGVR